MALDNHVELWIVHWRVVVVDDASLCTCIFDVDRCILAKLADIKRISTQKVNSFGFVAKGLIHYSLKREAFIKWKVFCRQAILL